MQDPAGRGFNKLTAAHNVTISNLQRRFSTKGFIFFNWGEAGGVERTFQTKIEKSFVYSRYTASVYRHRGHSLGKFA